jgi:hydrogenase-4 membrane subunit HyfE
VIAGGERRTDRSLAFMFSISNRAAAYLCWSLALLGVLVIVASWVVAGRAAEEAIRQGERYIDAGGYVIVFAVMVLGPGILLLVLTAEAYWQKWRVRELFAVLSTAYVTILLALVIGRFFG